MGLALVSVLWAYDGWGDLSFAAGEVKDPQRNLPRAIILGTLALIGIYVLTNVAYLYVIPITGIANPATPLVAADTMMALFGRTGVILVSVFVMISSFSSLNGSMLASPRVFFAMADDGMFFETIAKVHPRFKTPYVAILLAAVLGMALVMSRSFEALTETFVLAIWPFYALGIAAIYRLRRLRPEMPRPYKAIGYPDRPRHLHPLGRRVRHQRAHPRADSDDDHVRADPRRPAGLSLRVRAALIFFTLSGFLS